MPSEVFRIRAPDTVNADMPCRSVVSLHRDRQQTVTLLYKIEQG